MAHSPKFKAGIYAATVYQLAVAFFMLWLTRFAFAYYNRTDIDLQSFGELMRLAFFGMRFDLTAVIYFNALFIVMRILPFSFTSSHAWVKASMWVYGICNALLLAVNIGDIPYFTFTGARLRWSNVLTVASDSDAILILLKYAAYYWWTLLLGIAYITLTIWLAYRVDIVRKSYSVIPRICAFIILGVLSFLAMRGRTNGLPLAIPDATFYVRSAPQINVVLNSPFCVLRSLNTIKSNNIPVAEFMTCDELSSIRSSVHIPADSTTLNNRNIITIIIESGGAEWLDSLTILHKPGTIKLMPFLDSIIGKSTVFRNVIAPSRNSCAGTTAITGGFPAFDPFYFMLSAYNKNTVDAPASLLASKGYDTAFYYGVKKGSFNIDQTGRFMGYTKLFNRDSYANDKDYDGHWGIFDIPMAEYTVNRISELNQPFMALWFTINAHGPFSIPTGYNTTGFLHPERSPERGLEYTDRALRCFFELASKQTWYPNTTFIICADHGNREFKGTPYDGDYVRNRIPLIIYTPDGSMPAQMINDRVISQFDIAATTLVLAGYDEPFVSLGSNAFGNPKNLFGIHGCDGLYFIVDSDYGIYLDATDGRLEKVYDITQDPQLQHPIANYDTAKVQSLHRRALAFIQDYTTRLNENRMSISK